MPPPSISSRIKIPIDHYRTRPAHPQRLSGGSKPSAWQAGLPIVSVVTSARNAERTIGRAIASVTEQTYPNIEYVVIDGASTDGTVDILRQNDEKVTIWISEPDAGCEDGLNKALAFTTGQYIVFCNADDRLELDTVAVAVASMETNKCDFVYGDIIRDDIDGNFILLGKSQPDFKASIMFSFPIVSPSFAVNRRFIDAVGGWSDVRLNSDYNWFIRAHVAGMSGIYDERLKVHFSEGGHSNYVGRMIAYDTARMAISFGGDPIVAWLYFARLIVPLIIRDVLTAVVPAPLFQKVRPLIRKIRGISYTKPQ